MAFDGELNFVTLDDGIKRTLKDVFDRTSAVEEKIDDKTYVKKGIDLEVRSHKGNTIIHDITKVVDERYIVKVELENRYELFITPDHPVAVFKGGVLMKMPLCDVAIGDDMLVDDVRCQTISVKHYTTAQETYYIRSSWFMFALNSVMIWD